MTADIEELKRFLYSGTITQYGKRELIKYYEKQIKEQKQVIDEIKSELKREIEHCEGENAPLYDKCKIQLSFNRRLLDKLNKVKENEE